jgi:hypothetical protein
MLGAANTLQNKQQILRSLKQIKKNQETLEKKLDKIIDNQTTAQDAADAAATAAEQKKSLLRQFVEDSDMESLQAVSAVGSTIAGGIGLTNYFLTRNLTEQEKADLIEKTRTDYVIIEPLENNILMTDCYQKSDQINLFHIEKVQKSWYKFW